MFGTIKYGNLYKQLRLAMQPRSFILHKEYGKWMEFNPSVNNAIFIDYKFESTGMGTGKEDGGSFCVSTSKVQFTIANYNFFSGSNRKWVPDQSTKVNNNNNSTYNNNNNKNNFSHIAVMTVSLHHNEHITKKAIKIQQIQ